MEQRFVAFPRDTLLYTEKYKAVILHFMYYNKVNYCLLSVDKSGQINIFEVRT